MTVCRHQKAALYWLSGPMECPLRVQRQAGPPKNFEGPGQCKLLQPDCCRGFSNAVGVRRMKESLQNIQEWASEIRQGNFSARLQRRSETESDSLTDDINRLAEWLVVELLGMELRQAHIEAHRLEHGISPELEEKLVERLGHPKRSPFGRPIPLAGQPEKPLNSKTLDSVPLDTIFAVDRVPEEDMELLRFLSDAGIVPDQNIEVVEAAPYRGVIIVKSSKDRVSIGYNVATQIVIRPAELT